MHKTKHLRPKQLFGQPILEAVIKTLEAMLLVDQEARYLRYYNLGIDLSGIEQKFRKPVTSVSSENRLTLVRSLEINAEMV